MPSRTTPGIMRPGPPRRLALGQEPMRPFPSRHLAEIGAPRSKLIVHRAMAHAARGSKLAKREMIGIKQAQRLANARADEGACRLPWEGAAHIHVPEVKGWRAPDDPFGQRHARASGRLDTDGVEPTGNEESRHLRRLPQKVAVVVGEALRSVEE